MGFDPDKDRELNITGGPPPVDKRRRSLRPVIAFVSTIAAAALATGAVLVLTAGGGGKSPDGGGSDRVVTVEPAPPSDGITQAQLDALGDSLEARYRSGDTEVAQTMLDNFMKAHPECVAAVMAGGEGRPRDVLAESERVSKYLRSTAPYPHVYTTIVTVRNDDGGVRAAVLGVSCR